MELAIMLAVVAAVLGNSLAELLVRIQDLVAVMAVILNLRYQLLHTEHQTLAAAVVAVILLPIAGHQVGDTAGLVLLYLDIQSNFL
jgi:hypothetical protein